MTLNRQQILSLILAVLMALTALVTRIVTPAHQAPVRDNSVNLNTMIPDLIGEWKIDPHIVPLQLSPEVQKSIDSLYSQTLVRTYVNAKGEHVMLSIAYGGDQSGNLALHKPEHCYGAQGFAISHFSRDDYAIDHGTFPVTRLLAVQGYRSEPITYWTTVGDKVVRNGLEQKLQKLKYAMTGKIPDGILVRVSTIDTDLEKSYRLQNAFIRSLLSSMTEPDRDKLTGSTGT